MADNQEHEAVLAIEDDQNTGMQRKKTIVGNPEVKSKFMVKQSELLNDRWTAKQTSNLDKVKSTRYVV